MDAARFVICLAWALTAAVRGSGLEPFVVPNLRRGVSPRAFEQIGMQIDIGRDFWYKGILVDMVQGGGPMLSGDRERCVPDRMMLGPCFGGRPW